MESLIDKNETRLNNINKNIFIVLSDIIGNDTQHNYICIKSNDNSNLNIQIIDEDDLKDTNLNINTIEKNYNKNNNLNLNLIFENNNNNCSNHIIENKENKNIININQLYSNIKKNNSIPPIELRLMTPLDQSN